MKRYIIPFMFVAFALFFATLLTGLSYVLIKPTEYNRFVYVTSPIDGAYLGLILCALLLNRLEW